MGDIWSCKIGEADVGKLPQGADGPMRDAIINAFYQLTGEYPEYCFSGWGSSLTESEQACIDADRRYTW